MERVKKYFGIAVLIFLVIAGKSMGQLKLNISIEQEYSDNPFRSPVPTASFQSTLNFNAEAKFPGIKMGYYGSYSSFNEVPERNYYWHQAALFHEFSHAEIGVFAEQRINKKESAYFDYSGITAYYKQMFNLEDFYLSLSPNISYTKYDNISILDNLKGSLNFNINHSTDWGMTFIAGSGINYKYYLNPNSLATITYLNEDNTTEDETVEINNIESLTQLVSFGRLAKSISPTTGLAVQFINRRILTSIAEEVKDVNVIFGDESEMFDDPVTYEGNALSIELTQILFDDMIIKTGYYYFNKHYPTQGIYDEAYIYDTGYLRTDDQNIFSLSVSMKIPVNFLNETPLSIGFNYRYISNQSNSYWFNYKTNSYNINFGLNF